MPQSAPGRPIKLKPLLGWLGLILIIYIILFSDAPKYNEQRAEENLSHFSAILSKTAKIMGYESRLQYSNVQIQGFAYEKWALVSKLSTDMARETWIGAQRYGISSDNVRLIPHTIQPHRTQLSFPENINVIKGSDLQYVVNHTLPIMYITAGNKKNGSDTIEHHLSIAKGNNIVMTNHAHTIMLKFIDPSIVNITLQPPYNSLLASGGSGAIDAQYDEHRWKVASNRFHFSLAQKSPKTLETRGTLTIDGLSYTDDNHSTSPMSLNAAWVLNETHSLTGSIETSEFVIERSVLTDDNLHIAISGMLNFSVDDHMPYGEVTFEINDVNLLAASSWITDTYREVFIDFLKQITELDIKPQVHGIISVHREKGGQWYVGKIPFSVLMEKGVSNFLIFNKGLANDKTKPQ